MRQIAIGVAKLWCYFIDMKGMTEQDPLIAFGVDFLIRDINKVWERPPNGDYHPSFSNIESFPVLSYGFICLDINLFSFHLLKTRIAAFATKPYTSRVRWSLDMICLVPCHLHHTVRTAGHVYLESLYSLEYLLWLFSTFLSPIINLN